MNINTQINSDSNSPSTPEKPTIASLKRKSKDRQHPSIYTLQRANNAKVYADWLSKQGDCDLALTLTFRNKIYTDSTARKFVCQLNHKLRKLVYPKTALKLDKFNQGKHISIFAVLEDHLDKSIHIHAVVFKPPHNPKEINLKKEVLHSWSRLTTSFDNEAESLESIEDARRYIEYSMKFQKQNTDRVIIAYWDSYDLT